VALQQSMHGSTSDEMCDKFAFFMLKEWIDGPTFLRIVRIRKSSRGMSPCITFLSVLFSSSSIMIDD
jgi:hypothetical protein